VHVCGVRSCVCSAGQCWWTCSVHVCGVRSCVCSAGQCKRTCSVHVCGVSAFVFVVRDSVGGVALSNENGVELANPAVNLRTGIPSLF